VLSFWQQISERPLLKFSLFNGVTAALFGIGLYFHRRWRLQTTTHGLMLISMLLVPLTFWRSPPLRSNIRRPTS
jgi:hypothetical protein